VGKPPFVPGQEMRSGIETAGKEMSRHGGYDTYIEQDNTDIEIIKMLKSYYEIIIATHSSD
jgi:hypothetical protein